MARLFINVTHGPEHPTRAALGFLMAALAVEEGHEVSVFLAGDAVQLVRDPMLNSLSGLGTGNLRESFDRIVAGGGQIYASIKSSEVRGLTQEDIGDKAIQLVMPKMLVKLAIESDKALTY